MKNMEYFASQNPRPPLFLLFRFEYLISGLKSFFLKGIVGGFEFSFFQKNLKELARNLRPWKCVCEC